MINEESTVCVLGLGYIGLPTAALMASRGWNVFGVDIDPRVVQKVGLGKVHIIEPDLDGLVQKVVSTGKLRAGLEPIEADVFIITRRFTASLPNFVPEISSFSNRHVRLAQRPP
jgi:UDP-N-acetyl-D-mannosaminuronic acid dehydrogenase